MASHPAIRRRSSQRRLLQAQTVIVVLGTLLGLAAGGVLTAMSAMTGGLVCLVPNLYFVWRLRGHHGGRQARRYVANFYRAEAGKFGLTVALFVTVFVLAPPSNPIFFFSAYVAVHFVHWLAPWLMRERPTP